MDTPLPPGPTGLVLLTGGRGRRLQGPKHDRPHPCGGTWGGHLAGVFQAVFPEGPKVLLGSPLPDRPDLPALPDDGEGPARALAAWAGREDQPQARRWWIVACDQVHWTPGTLSAWHREVRAADPGAESWILGRAAGRVQILGGFLPGHLRPALAGSQALRLSDLPRGLPTRILPVSGEAWMDVDTPGALASWLDNPASKSNIQNI